MEAFRIENINGGAELEKFNHALSLAFSDFDVPGKEDANKRAVTYRLEMHKDQAGNSQIRGKLDVKLGRSVPRETFSSTFFIARGKNGQLEFEFPETSEDDPESPVPIRRAK